MNNIETYAYRLVQPRHLLSCVEKLIFELATEDNIEGNMVEDVFEFQNDHDVIISLLSKLIDNM